MKQYSWMIEPKRITLDEDKMNIKLYKYYIEKTAENPFYPVTKENLHKILTSVITVKGLQYFYFLRRKLIKVDSNLSRLELASLGSLWFHYATTNRNLHEVLEWENYMFRVGVDKDFRTLKPILRKEEYIVANNDYDPKQIKYHRIWKDALIGKIYYKSSTVKSI